MTLTTLIMAAIFSLSPATPPERAEELADAIAFTTESQAEAMALVTTAWHEGRFDRDVQTCRKVGDGGRALTLYQMHRSWRGGFADRDVCRDLTLSTQLALRALRKCRGGGTARQAFAAYTGRSTRDAEVQRRTETYERLLRLISVAEKVPHAA